MTKEEFLQDTIKYYSENTDRRCVASPINESNNILCYYSPLRAGKVGRTDGCAIGRHLADSDRVKFDNWGGRISRIVNSADMSKLLPKWMKDMSPHFLDDVQSLHDTNTNWDSEGITPLGKAAINDIIDDYQLSLSYYD